MQHKQISYVQIWDMNVSISASYEPTRKTPLTRSTDIHTPYIMGIFPWYNSTATLHVSPHRVVHMSKDKKMTHSFHIQFYICTSSNMPMKCHIYAIQSNYLTCINLDICQYICHTWSHWHQPCDQECCTQEPMLAIPIPTCWCMMMMLDCTVCFWSFSQINQKPLTLHIFQDILEGTLLFVI